MSKSTQKEISDGGANRVSQRETGGEAFAG